jgi:hypothetical protein
VARHHLVPRLRGLANLWVGRFGEGTEVYLVGSALVKEHPVDVDVSIILPDATFIQRYGVSFVQGKSETNEDRVRDFFALQYDPNWPVELRRWGRETAKVTGHLDVFTGIAVDLKIQAASHAARWYAHKPRLRLDDLYEEAPPRRVQAPQAKRRRQA